MQMPNSLTQPASTKTMPLADIQCSNPKAKSPCFHRVDSPQRASPRSSPRGKLVRLSGLLRFSLSVKQETPCCPQVSHTGLCLLPWPRTALFFPSSQLLAFPLKFHLEETNPDQTNSSLVSLFYNPTDWPVHVFH